MAGAALEEMSLESQLGGACHHNHQSSQASLDHRAAAPGGQSGRWLISGTGLQCAVLFLSDMSPSNAAQGG